MFHLVIATLLVCSKPIPTDSLPSVDTVVTKLPARYLSQVQKKSDHIESEVNKRSAVAVDRMFSQEKKMQGKMMKIDSVAAKNIFSHSIDSLNNLKAMLKSKLPGNLTAGAGGAYLDTLQNSLKFLSGSDKVAPTQLSNATASLNSLQNQFQQADQIKGYIRDQQQQLNTQLAHYTGFSNDLQNMNKEAYYYKQQINEYKATLQDKKKAEEKGMELLKKLPAYNQFIQQHSMFASLFNLSGSSSAVQGLEGLQTRTQVEQLISQRVGTSPGAQAAVSQQMDAARSKFNDLKSKFPDADNAADMPNFKPNPMKTKSLLQRLEFGANVQFQKSTQYFPTTGDFAGQVGYKFNKNGSIGLGISYKLGMGAGWNNIAFTHQGVGLRSFMDYKLKGTFFVNGGFEENYTTTFAHIDQLKDWRGWQGSALLGISKKYKINSKLKGNIMVLYDFLASRNIPPTSPVKVRMGYTF